DGHRRVRAGEGEHQVGALERRCQVVEALDLRIPGTQRVVAAHPRPRGAEPARIDETGFAEPEDRDDRHRPPPWSAASRCAGRSSSSEALYSHERSEPPASVRRAGTAFAPYASASAREIPDAATFSTSTAFAG